MQKNVRQLEVLKQIMEPNAEKCVSAKFTETAIKKSTSVKSSEVLWHLKKYFSYNLLLFNITLQKIC
ncbi:hypothetical protein BWZ43_02880 [Heyndrickxia oleronia]|jgi:hypothetical protein|uniref:Uncharacterized protein n=1 Tax=Heyndrickxia oleronia TaxID=38875 RepID=A0A8E2IBH6_9BACI|nr:hypothetical protein BWZ43_02880 [Heyndrickxia oleronia]